MGKLVEEEVAKKKKNNTDTWLSVNKQVAHLFARYIYAIEFV